MFRYITLALVFVPISTALLHAQTATLWKHFGRPDIGVGLTTHTLAESDTVSSGNLDSRYDARMLSVGVGVYLPFVALAEELTLGLNPNAELGTSLGYEALQFSLELPIYATLKYGTDATWLGSRGAFGFAVGVGYRYSALFGVSESYSYSVPQAMAEFNIGKRRSGIGLVKFRYSRSLVSDRQEFFTSGDAYPIVFSNQEFQLLFVLGY